MWKNEAGWTVITGSTGGIGSAIAEQLARRGDPLVLVNRSESKAAAQKARLLAIQPSLRLELIATDLLDVTRVAESALAIRSLPGHVDTLYNNAGILTGTKVLSAQGFESQFAVNTLAAYQLTRALQTCMARPLDARPALVVNFSSSAIKAVKELDLGALARPEQVGGLMTTYAQTKLAVTALAPALDAELRADNILIRAVDPGATRSPMTTEGNSGMPAFLRWLAPLLFAPADKQAAKLIDSADPGTFDGRSGILVANRKVRKLPPLAADPTKQRELIALLDRLLAAALT